MDAFFERPVVWLCSLCVLALVLLARCGEREVYDPYAWQGAQPDGAEVGCYEYEMVPGFDGTESRSVYAEATPLRSSGESEMVENSLPPTGNWE